MQTPHGCIPEVKHGESVSNLHVVDHVLIFLLDFDKLRWQRQIVTQTPRHFPRSRKHTVLLFPRRRFCVDIVNCIQGEPFLIYRSDYVRVRFCHVDPSDVKLRRFGRNPAQWAMLDYVSQTF